jgi:hypothetical protein
VIGLDDKNFEVALHVEPRASDVLCHDLYFEVEVSVLKRSYQHMVFAVHNSEVVRVDKSRVRPPVADLACA